MNLAYFNQSLLAWLLMKEQNLLSREILKGRLTLNLFACSKVGTSSMCPYWFSEDQPFSVSCHINLLLAIYENAFVPLIFMSLIEQLHQWKHFMLETVKTEVIMMFIWSIYCCKTLPWIQSLEANSDMNTKLYRRNYKVWLLLLYLAQDNKGFHEYSWDQTV